MEILLLGIKNNNNIHLGHFLGIIKPALKMLLINNNLLLIILIADYHTLTNINLLYYNKYKYINYLYKIIAIILSFNISLKRIFFYKQSNINDILEIFWYFSSLYTINRLKLSHLFKKYKLNLKINAFLYPILMSSDIVALNSNYVFIGKDQIQHLEICKVLIKKINIFSKYKFIIPKIQYKKKYYNFKDQYNKKMSKKNNNIFSIYLKKDIIYKKILKIKTSNECLNKYNIKKNYIYMLYKILLKQKNIKKKLYKNNNFLKIKNDLYKRIINKYIFLRKKYFFYLQHKYILKNLLYKNKFLIKKIILKNIYWFKYIFIN
ncbi:MAG: hypothetical protein ABPD24_00330 [Candidatus Shikimatogenerans sp. AspAUS03]|uniref:tryptophan--tRNA ligase n=1 Tax=Candidatus Shikimatogenerans sp. AspAUS03 TaxID=3158563 RepID=A0AAU7QT40_9FLAO